MSQEAYREFAAHTNRASARADRQMTAVLLIQAATLSLLVESGVTTADDAVERIREFQARFPAVFGDEIACAAVEFVEDILHGRAPLRGSEIERVLQRRERERAAH